MEPTTDPAELSVRRQLDELGIEHEIVPCDPDLADTAAFCEAYGYAPEDSANTIVVAGKSTPPVYAACVVLATTRLDVNGTVRRRLGARKASFASADETREMTGMLIGGVTAFGLPPDAAGLGRRRGDGSGADHPRRRQPQLQARSSPRRRC